MNDCCFHLAFPVHDLEAAKRFYVDGLGFTLGRISRQALIINFEGHQVIAHLVKAPLEKPTSIYPRHFGLNFFSKASWDALLERAQARELMFYRKPSVRFLGLKLEHHSFLLVDPSHNLLEFKHYTYPSAILGEQHLTDIGETNE